MRAFEADRYLIRRKILTIFGASFHVYDDGGRLLAFSRQKAFKLREDIRVFEDEGQQKPLLSIRARQIVDFSAAYDVVDARTDEKVGAARRKGLRSILRDSWELLDDHDRPMGRVVEDSSGMALARRFLSNLIPQRFHVVGAGERRCATFKQRFNPFVYKLEVALEDREALDPRLVFAVGVLLAAIEGRQS